MAQRIVELPLHITELESPEGFRIWQLEMQQYLIATDLWKWTNVENKDAPTAEIPALPIDGRNQIVRTTALTAPEENISIWKRGHELVCNAIISRLGTYYFYEFQDETNAYELWNRIKGYFKPADLTTLNNLYRLLNNHSLKSCKDAADYAGQFKSIYNDILRVHPKLQFEENYLIFRFHTGLGKEYQDYVNTYTQTHEAIKDYKPAYSLEYAIARFLQTVRNEQDRHRNKRSRNKQLM